MPNKPTRNPPDDPCGPQKAIAPTRSIRLRTAIPGPVGVARLTAYEQATGYAALSTVVSEKAHGALMYDVDGNILIDLASGRSLPTGHTPDHLLEILRGSVETLIGLEARTALDNTLSRLSEYLARVYRPRFEADIPDIQARLYVSSVEAADAAQSVGMLVQPFDDDFQPISSAPGNLPAILDERGLGAGQAGQPSDIMPAAILTDGFSAGLSLAAIIGPRQWLERLPRPTAERPASLACIAAENTLRHIASEQLVGRAEQVGGLIGERLTEWRQAYPIFEQFSGLGCLWSLHFQAEFASRFHDEALQRGVISRLATNSTILLLPPMMIPEEQLHEALDALESALYILSAAN